MGHRALSPHQLSGSETIRALDGTVRVIKRVVHA